MALRDWSRQPGGPVTFDDLKTMSLDGRLRREDLVWNETLPAWTTAASVGSLFEPAGPPTLLGDHLPPLNGTTFRERTGGVTLPPGGGRVFHKLQSLSVLQDADNADTEVAVSGEASVGDACLAVGPVEDACLAPEGAATLVGLDRC